MDKPILMKLGIVVCLGLLVISGCGTSATGGSNADQTKDEQQGLEKSVLDTSLEMTLKDGKVIFEIGLTNEGKEALELPFSSGQLFEITVTNESGQEVYRYSEGRMFTMALQNIEIDAGKTLTWVEEWDISAEKDLSAGQYTAEVAILVQPDEFVGAESIDTEMLKTTGTLLLEESDLPMEDSSLPAGEDNTMPADGEIIENEAFRNIMVREENGQYTVTGEARVFEATVSYAVTDGHNYIIEDFETASEGAPGWGEFKLEIDIDENDTPENGTFILELFEYSAKDGSKINILQVPLVDFAAM
jgi:hypothetical protein